jgi:hypothetical protein
MWGYMKEWCKLGCLPDDRELRADVTAIGYDGVGAILLEKKDGMLRRLSPGQARNRRHDLAPLSLVE